jgi:8-oxo-dGTP pyrophosphatase MutT (NUDIX family)
MKDKKKNIAFEFSAGGVVVKDGKVLMIRTTNLSGEEVWTFPKGHIEKGETSKEAAIREVAEETGYVCEIKDYIDEVKYLFKRGEKLVIKTVKWFTMEITGETGKEAEEVDEIKWASPDEAVAVLSYKTDLDILAKIFKKQIK